MKLVSILSEIQVIGSIDSFLRPGKYYWINEFDELSPVLVKYIEKKLIDDEMYYKFHYDLPWIYSVDEIRDLIRNKRVKLATEKNVEKLYNQNLLSEIQSIGGNPWNYFLKNFEKEFINKFDVTLKQVDWYDDFKRLYDIPKHLIPKPHEPQPLLNNKFRELWERFDLNHDSMMGVFYRSYLEFLKSLSFKEAMNFIEEVTDSGDNFIDEIQVINQPPLEVGKFYSLNFYNTHLRDGKRRSSKSEWSLPNWEFLGTEMGGAFNYASQLMYIFQYHNPNGTRGSHTEILTTDRNFYRPRK